MHTEEGTIEKGMGDSLSYYNAIRYSPEVKAHYLTAIEEGFNFDKLVVEGIYRVTEGEINSDKNKVIVDVVEYIARVLQECIARRMATKPATTRFGRFRMKVGKAILFIGHLVGGDSLKPKN